CENCVQPARTGDHGCRTQSDKTGPGASRISNAEWSARILASLTKTERTEAAGGGWHGHRQRPRMTTSTPILSNAQLHAALTNWWRKRKRPATRRPFAGIEIDVECGYGAAADVPRIFV